MSEAGDIKPELDRADVEARAADFLQRRRFWDWGAAEDAELEFWLNESVLHRVAFLRLEAGQDRVERLAALGPAKPEPISAVSRAPFVSLFLRIAAVAAIAAVIGVAATNFFESPQDRLFSTQIGGRETVAFADGSRIELNTSTILRARMTTQERIVWLDKGEAYFRIKHDALHPFIVMVGDHRVTDLGTQFLVRREPAKLEVAVVQGRVTFDAPNRPQHTQVVLLAPGDVATAASGKLSVTTASARALDKELSWRRGVLVFDNTMLGDAAAQFNRYNRQKLIIADPAASSMTIVGTFRTSDVELFAHATRDALGLRIENRGNDIVISSRLRQH
jgi:transmembrane sensor